jgi:hypothetical protein
MVFKDEWTNRRIARTDEQTNPKDEQPAGPLTMSASTVDVSVTMLGLSTNMLDIL